MFFVIEKLYNRNKTGAKIILLKIYNYFKFVLNEIIDLIYKRKCIECSCLIQDGILCKTCSKTVQNLPPFQQGVINGYKLYSVFYYEGIIKTIIHKLKFNHRKECAYYSALYFYDFIKNLKEYEKDNLNFENAIIVPILTHKNNKNKRGYDNVFEICKELSKLTGFKLKKDVLTKIKDVPPQYTLSVKQRINNPKGAFSLDKNFKTKNLVILIDDIVTTGSTLEFITSLFKENGIKNLICLTLAKTKNSKNSF